MPRKIIYKPKPDLINIVDTFLERIADVRCYLEREATIKTRPPN